MKEKNWHKIFNKKNFSYIDQSNFIKKEKDFLATSYLLTKIVHTGLDKKNYKKIINFIYEKLKIKKRSSLLDFGSGNGGLLYYFLKKYNLINNYSFEISAPLLKIHEPTTQVLLLFGCQAVVLLAATRSSSSSHFRCTASTPRTNWFRDPTMAWRPTAKSPPNRGHGDRWPTVACAPPRA